MPFEAQKYSQAIPDVLSKWDNAVDQCKTETNGANLNE